jgi:hypothetical protein
LGNYDVLIEHTLTYNIDFHKMKAKTKMHKKAPLVAASGAGAFRSE